MADRVAVMYLGRIVEIGPTEEVLLRPLHPYTRALLDVVPEAGGLDRPILTGEPPDPTRVPPGCRFHPRCPVVVTGKAADLGIEAACKGEDLGLEEIKPGQFAACHASRQLGAEAALAAIAEVEAAVAPEPISQGSWSSDDEQDDPDTSPEG